MSHSGNRSQIPDLRAVTLMNPMRLVVISAMAWWVVNFAASAAEPAPPPKEATPAKPTAPPPATETPQAAEPTQAKPVDDDTDPQPKKANPSQADKAASPQRFTPSEQVRADFDVSFPIDI